MTFIVKSLLSLVLQGLASLGDVLGGSMLSLLTMDIGTSGSVFDIVFGSIVPIAGILQYFAFGLLILMSVWAMIKTMYTPEGSGETPIQIIATTLVAGFLIYAGPTLLRIFENLFNQIYKWILTMHIEGASVDMEVLFDEMIGTVTSTFAGAAAAGAGASAAGAAGTAIAVATVADVVNGDLSLTALLAGLVMSLLISYEFVMFILEVIERYVVLGVLFYTSPLAFAMAGTKSTRNVFASWCRMFGSQMFLMITNVVFFRLFILAQRSYMATVTALRNTPLVTDPSQTPSYATVTILYFMMLYAILHVGTKMDSYLGTIGLSAAQTGRGLGQSVIMTAAGVGRVLRAAGRLGRPLGRLAARATQGSRQTIGNAVGNAFRESKVGGNYGSSVSFRNGSSGKVATAETMSDLMEGKLSKNAQQQMDGTLGGNSLKTVLKEQQDSNYMPDDTIRKMDAFSFRSESAAQKSGDHFDRYGAFEISMAGEGGNELQLRGVPIDKNGITKDGLDTTQMAGRHMSINGQDIFMHPVPSGENGSFTPAQASLMQEFVTGNTGMQQYMDKQNKIPGVSMEQGNAPGTFVRTETNADGSIRSQQLYTDPNLYAPKADSYMSAKIGDRAYNITDITQGREGLAASAQNFEIAQAQNDISALGNNAMAEFSSIPQAEATQFHAYNNGEILSYQDNNTCNCLIPTSKYSVNEQVAADAGISMQKVYAASNGAEYLQMSFPRDSSQGALTHSDFTQMGISSIAPSQTISVGAKQIDVKVFAEYKHAEPIYANGSGPSATTNSILSQARKRRFDQQQKK